MFPNYPQSRYFSLPAFSNIPYHLIWYFLVLLFYSNFLCIYKCSNTNSLEATILLQIQAQRPQDFGKVEYVLRAWLASLQVLMGADQQQGLPSYYSILGVSSESSINEIKRAYRKLAMVCINWFWFDISFEVAWYIIYGWLFVGAAMASW